MNAKQLSQLKAMSTEHAATLPDSLLTDGCGNFFDNGGKPVSSEKVLALVNEASRQAQELDDVIQGIEGRKPNKT